MVFETVSDIIVPAEAERTASAGIIGRKDCLSFRDVSLHVDDSDQIPHSPFFRAASSLFFPRASLLLSQYLVTFQ